MLTQVGQGGLLFRLTCSVGLCGGRGTADKYHWRVRGALAVSRPRWVCPRSQHVCFPVYTAQASGCSAGSRPGLRALPRSKQLRFRFSGTPQRGRLGWACILCLPRLSSSGNQVRGERALLRCGAFYHRPGPSRSGFRAPQSLACRVSLLGS